MNSFYQNVFTPAVKRAGLEGVRFHDLRHTYASLMLTLVQSPYWISEQLGHADYVITLRTYTRLISPKDTTQHPLFGQGLAADRSKGRQCRTHLAAAKERQRLTRNATALPVGWWGAAAASDRNSAGCVRCCAGCWCGVESLDAFRTRQPRFGALRDIPRSS